MSIDGILVLGGGRKSGKSRISFAYHLVENNNLPIILSGNRTDKFQFSKTLGRLANFDVPEAEFMKNYLISRGIDERRIYVESCSFSTIQNFAYSKPIVEKLGIRNLGLVTDKASMGRAYFFGKNILHCNIIQIPTDITDFFLLLGETFFRILYSAEQSDFIERNGNLKEFFEYKS